MSVRRYLLLAMLVTTGAMWGESSRLTHNDPFPLYTTKYPYNFFSTDERRIAKDMRPLHQDGAWLQYSVSALRSTADFSTDIFQQKHKPLFNLPGPWNFTGLFYDHSPVRKQGEDAIRLTPFQAFLASELDINLMQDESRDAFANVIDPMNADTKHEFGFVDVPGEYRKHGIRFELEARLFCDLGFRVRTGVSDIRSTPCIESIIPNPATENDDQSAAVLRDERRCDFFQKSCDAQGRTCPASDGEAAIDEFTMAQKDIVLNKIIKQFETISKLLGYDATAYNETDVEDLELQVYWRRTFHVNEDRTRWPYFIITPFFTGHAILPIAEEVPPTELFALPQGNNGFGAYGFSGGFSVDFIDMVQIAFDAGMTKFSEEERSCVPVPIRSEQQGILPRTATAVIEPGTNWTFGAALYGYYFFDYLSFHIEYRIVSHTEDEIRYTSVNKLSEEQLDKAREIANNPNNRVNLVRSDETFFGDDPIEDTFSIDDIHKRTVIERSKWESHVVNIGLNYDISPNVSLGFLWQAPATQRNAFKQTSLLWSIIATF